MDIENVLILDDYKVGQTDHSIFKE